MSNFKGRSSRFAKTSGSNSGSSESTARTSGSRPSRSGDRTRSGGTAKQYAFTRIASLTLPKKMSDEVKEYIMEELRGSEDIRFNAKIYLPKGAESVTLATGDMMTLSFRVSDKDPDFVVGHVSIPNNSSSEGSDE